MFEDLGQDIRYGLRTLAKRPGFTVIAVLTIGLGIGATTTLFSLVSGILLRPLSYREPDRLVAVWPDYWFSKPLLRLLEEGSTSYEALTGWAPRAYTLIGDDGAHRLWGPRVTAGFFDVLGRDLAAGRTLREGDDRPGANVVVISYGLWQRRYGGDPEVIGRTIRLSGIERTIVGVMERGFDFMQQDANVAVPQIMDPDAPGWGSQELKVAGRLKSGISVREAAVELRTLTARWREEYDLPVDWGVDAGVIPLREFRVGSMRPTVLLLFGAAGLILLIATANVANLLLARSISRRREISLRLALGARPVRVASQLLTETSLLGLFGGFVGLGAAAFGLDLVLTLLPSDTPRLGEVRIDGLVLGFSVLIALVTGWVVGVTPALQSARTDLRAGLGGGLRGATETRNRRRLRSGIAMSEVALAVMLVIGSGLLIKSFWRLSQVDPGFRAEGLLMVDLVPERGKLESHAEAEVFYANLEQLIGAIPGVRSTAIINMAPLAPDGAIVSINRADQPPEPGASPPIARWRPVTRDFFGTAEIPLLAGRRFAASDVAAGQQVAVISKSAAEQLFPDGDALGREVIGGLESQLPVTVVGIAGDVRNLGLDQESPLMLYRPYAQVGETADIFRSHARAVMLRADGDPAALAPQVRAAVLTVDPNALISNLQTMPDAISASLTRRRVTMMVFSIFAATAVILGAIGVYGVMGYTVEQRTKEIGVRVAVGASGTAVLRQVLGDGLKIAVLGTAVGIAISLALSRLLARFLFEISTSDPWILTGASAMAIGVALVATLFPARRAVRVDPLEALRAE